MLRQEGKLVKIHCDRCDEEPANFKLSKFPPTGGVTQIWDLCETCAKLIVQDFKNKDPRKVAR